MKTDLQEFGVIRFTTCV